MVKEGPPVVEATTVSHQFNKRRDTGTPADDPSATARRRRALERYMPAHERRGRFLNGNQEPPPMDKLIAKTEADEHQINERRDAGTPADKPSATARRRRALDKSNELPPHLRPLKPRPPDNAA